MVISVSKYHAPFAETRNTLCSVVLRCGDCVGWGGLLMFIWTRMELYAVHILPVIMMIMMTYIVNDNEWNNATEKNDNNGNASDYTNMPINIECM